MLLLKVLAGDVHASSIKSPLFQRTKIANLQHIIGLF